MCTCLGVIMVMTMTMITLILMTTLIPTDMATTTGMDVWQMTPAMRKPNLLFRPQSKVHMDQRLFIQMKLHRMKRKSAISIYMRLISMYLVTWLSQWQS
mmetsp:Transcript_24073/g.48728  ORF Transcript_24073/g.48728 Transcript_24073/m.48728 type:complete len:99 (-) Transcript_24073:576-872(-)